MKRERKERTRHHDRDGEKYRSQPAQQFHQTILRFMNGEIYRLPDRVDRNILLEVSINGYSHLHDVLRFGYRPGLKDRINPERKHTAVSFLIEKAKNHGYSVLASLFLLKAKDGTSILDACAQSNDLELFKLCFNEIKYLLREKYITQNEYRDLLTAVNGAGFTSLHRLLYESRFSPEIIMYYFDLVREQIEKNRIHPSFMMRVVKGFSPLDVAFSRGDMRLVTAYHNLVLYFLHQINIIWVTEYRSLLMIPEGHRYSSFCGALLSQNSSIIKFYTEEMIEYAYKNDYIDSEELREIILGTKSFPVLAFVIQRMRVKIFEIFIIQIKRMISRRLLTDNDLLHQLTASDINGLTIMHHCANSGRIEILRLYLDELTQLFYLLPVSKYQDYLRSVSKSGYNIIHCAALSASYEVFLSIIKCLIVAFGSYDPVVAMLNTPTRCHHLPRCNEESDDADRINEFIDGSQRRGLDVMAGAFPLNGL